MEGVFAHFFSFKITEMLDVLKKTDDVARNIRRFPCLLTILIVYLPGM